MMKMASFTITLVIIAMTISYSVYGKKFCDHGEIEVQSLLKRLNKPALKSIQSEDGDIIDCILITSQPAFDHPLLKNHTIQMRPSFIPEVDSKYTKKKGKNIAQVWHKNGTCPDNTVSIRRIKKEDILRAKSVESFGKKAHQSIPQESTSGSTVNHEHAIMGSKNGKFYGTKFVINVWNPSVQVPEEFSLAQTWLLSGDGSNLNTIEAGLQVYPRIYGDYNTRLFVYWTNNGYQGSGCYNLGCSGFVQRSNIFTVGGSLTPVSQYDGDQNELSMLIWKDGENWWLKIGEELVGYWPGSLFTSLGDGATEVQWGGEITNYKTDGKHTATDMGSGHFADEWFKKASYFKKLMVVDGTNSMREPEGLYTFAANENCYNVKPGNSGNSYWGVHFFYGGPGQNDKCL